jgi:uncharacterized protein with von Willebrand factor type A (vWA) domain
LKLRNFCLCAADEHVFQSLQGAAQWSKIKKAYFTCPKLLKLLSRNNAQLTELELELDSRFAKNELVARACTFTPDILAIRELIQSQKGLESLQLSNATALFIDKKRSLVDSICQQLGQTLRLLRVHENEQMTEKGRSKRVLLREYALYSIGRHCQKLRSFCLDIPPGGLLVS